MFTPGTTAPAESLTLPRSVAVDWTLGPAMGGKSIAAVALGSSRKAGNKSVAKQTNENLVQGI